MVEDAHKVAILHILTIEVDHALVLRNAFKFQNEWVINFTHDIDLVEQVGLLSSSDKLILALKFDCEELVFFV